jgi:biopolymer transport protein ExbD
MTFVRKSQEEVGFQMAPMIDIIFTLLLFYVVTTALQELEKSITVDLPQTAEGARGERSMSEIVINITRDGDIRVYSELLTINVLSEKLRQLAKLYKGSVPAVIVRGDKQVNYGRVVEVLDVCAQANMYNVSFVSIDK